MKKIIKLLLIISIISAIIIGCSKNNNQNQNDNTIADETITTTSNEKIKIVTTIFPEYDWIREIIGENIDKYDLTYLLDNGVDLHNFQPTVADIAKIKSADMFVYVGGESDAWVENVFNNVVEKNIIKINLMELMGDRAKLEELKEGMQDSEHHEDEEHAEEEEHHENEEHEDHDHEAEYDEHLWLSVKNAEFACRRLYEKIVELDPENQKIYETNLDNYLLRLKELDDKYYEVANNAAYKTILFGDRFPFRYLVDDYKIDYYAAFVGCSAESEASFETIIFLAKKVDELGLKHVMRIEGSNDKIAKTIIDNTQDKNQDILVMDSMQATSVNDVKNGANYIDIMKKNLEVFEKALN